MQDAHGREITYLRISVTDRCNFRCRYCSRPSQLLPRDRIMTFEDIVTLVKASQRLGFRKVRLTGGEPLLRQDIGELVSMLHGLGIRVSLTTNGSLLALKSRELKSAGLDSINVSLDFVDPVKFTYMDGGDVALVLRGIEAAVASDLETKINVVFTAKHERRDLVELLHLAESLGTPFRFIELMPKNGSSFNELFRPIGEAKSMLESITTLAPDEVPPDSGPVEYYVTAEGVKVGLIAFFSMNKCLNCNRLRVGSNGVIYPCLFRTAQVDALERLRSGVDGAVSALLEALSIKPLHGNPEEIGPEMQEIGG